MASPEKEKLQAAMQDELNSLNDISIWTLVDRPKDRKVITGRWVYKIKTDDRGNIDKFKARYVAKGFMRTFMSGLSWDVCSNVQTRNDENFFRTSCSVGPRASSDGRQNGLLNLTFDRNGLHGTTRRIHRGQRQSVFTSTQCLWFEASRTRLVSNAKFFFRENGFH